MSDTAIGFAIEIPKSVLEQISTAQEKIFQLEEQARTSADKINKSFISLSNNGLEYFIKKLKEAQTAMSGVGFADTKGITDFAKAIVEAANAVNRMGSADRMTGIVPPTTDVERLRSELDRLSKAYDELSKQRTKGTSATRGQTAAEKEATKAINMYNKAMAANEGTVVQRKNKIVKLREAERMLTETGREYAGQLTRIRQETERLTRENNNAEQATNRFRRQQSQLARTSEQLKRALAMFFSVSQVRGYIASVAQVTGEFEKQNRALQAILQNKDEADKLFGQITDLAVRSPFQLKELVTYTKQLSAYRIEQDKLYDTTKMLADVSAGLGVSMDRLILAYGQIKAAGYLRGCLGYGTPVMLYDGTIKQVQDIVVGDVLINEKGEPVNVLELIRGRETMFLVEQVSGHDRTSYRVNRNHILTLWNVQEQRLEDVYVYDYLKNTEAYLGLRIVDGEKVYYDIEVTKDRIDDYYGFVLDGNKRFRLGDGTITHNTETRQLTEAGINVYGELADYYSELEGRIVSVNEVMDRQFKRMISFEDVNEVFRRLTEEGGIFFNMQELQADTVAGMISNLKDSMDIMKNEIGQNYEGNIKGVLSTLKILIDNYQVVETVIKSVSLAFAAYTVRAIAAAAANARLAKSGTDAAKRLLDMRKAQGIGTAFEKLGKSMSMIKPNPILAIVAAVSAAVIGINKWRKAVEDARKEYDVLSRQLLSSRDNLNSLVVGIEKQTSIYEQSVKEMESLTEGTAEYTAASERAAAAEKERNALIAKLKKDFPEVAAAYSDNSDSVEAMTEAQREYNKELEATLALNYAMEMGHGWFDEGILKDLEDYAARQKDYNKSINTLTETFAYARNEVEKMFAAFSKGEEEYRGAFDDIVNSSDGVYDKIKSIVSMLGQISTGEMDGFAVNARKILRSINKDFNAAQRSTRKLQSALKEANLELDEMISYALSNQGLSSTDMFASASLQAQETIRKSIEQFVRGIPNIMNEEVQKLVNEKLLLTLGFTIDFGNAPQEFTWLQNQINDYIDRNGLDVSLKIKTPTQDVDNYFKSLENSVKGYKEEIERLDKATEKLVESDKDARTANAERKKELEDLAAQYEQVLRAYGRLSDEDKNKTVENQGMQRLQERINLVKEMRREYERLIKTYSPDEASRIVRESFADTAKEMGMSELVATMSFEPQGIIDAFNTVMRQVIANLEGYSEEIVQKLELALKKAMDNYSVQVGVDVVVERRDEIREQFEDMFSGYTLTMQVEDMGMDKNTAQRLFGLDVVTLDDIKKKLEEVRGELTGEDGLKLYQQLSGKIQDIEAKALMDRMKTYNDYMKKSISERAALEIAAAKEAAKIRSTAGLSDEVKEALLRRLQEETAKSRADMEWKDFRESEIYVRMFEELDYVSDATLQRMRQRLDEIKESIGSAFSPEQMRSFMSAYNDIESQIISRNPFKALVSSMREIRVLEKEGRSESYLENEILVLEAQKSSFEQQTADLEVIIGLKEANLGYDSLSQEFLVRNNELLEMSVEELRAMVAANKLAVSGLETDIGIDEADLRTYADARNALSYVANELNTIRSLGGKAFDSIKSILVDLGVESDSVAMTFVDMGASLLDMVGQAMMFGMQLKLMSAQAAALGIAMNSALGPLGWIVMGLQAVATVMKKAFAAQDKARQDAIDAELDNIKKLEREYEKLARTVESALTAGEGRRATQEAVANLEDQIYSYQKALAAERDQKESKQDKDAIDEYTQGIEDAEEKIKKLREQYLSDLGGFGSQENMRSAAQEFIDVWMDAYKETGNGLDALTDKWNEYFENIVAQQMMLKATDSFLNPVFNLVDSALEDWTLSSSEAKDIQEKFEEMAPQLNDFLKSIAGMFGIVGGAEGGDMSELQKGIQSITETTGQALEALMNSVRFFVADSNTQLHLLVSTLTATEGYPNPMLDELRSHTRLLTAIQSLLSSIIKSGHPEGGYGVKTFI